MGGNMKAGRNEPCPCGSGRKYKNCCLGKGLPGSEAAGSATGNPAGSERPEQLHTRLAALFNSGQYEAAERLARRLLESHPESGFAWLALGSSLTATGKDGIPALKKATALLPDNRDAHFNLTKALRDLGRLDEAADAYRRVLQLEPEDVEAHFHFGCFCETLGRLDEAEANLRHAAKTRPDFAEAHCVLARVLRKLGRAEEAKEEYRQALAINPGLFDAHTGLATILYDLLQLDEAAASLRRALALRPDSGEAHTALAITLSALGQTEEAARSFRHGLELKSDNTNGYGSMLCFHSFSRSIPPQEECALAARWENLALSESERESARRRFLPPHWQPSSPGTSPDPEQVPEGPTCPSPRRGRKLRLGIVSAEIGQHAVAEFLQPVLERLDRTRFHVALFPTIERTEARSREIRRLADTCTLLAGMSDAAAAAVIRAAGIDVLVDTSGHTQNGRLGIFAHRAAPVQCHYLGYPGTTGLTEMDWFLGDPVLLPGFCDPHFREGIWRLPRLWIAYRGDNSLPDSQWTPSADGTIWLGSFNNFSKVRAASLGLWARTMNAIPESRLLLKDRQSAVASVRERILGELLRHGIAAERIEFAAPDADWRSHMAQYDRLDIALDPIPLSSGTTAFDALWMGVPLVAVEGDWMGGRMSSTILRSLGKAEWVAQGEDEYVDIVARLARDVAGRTSLRRTQRALMAASPLCDADAMARTLEDAFEQMFDRWQERILGPREDGGKPRVASTP